MKNWIQTIGALLRKTLLSVFVITDDVPFSLNEFYRRTVESRHRILIYALIGGFWCLCLLGVVKTIPNISKSHTTFNVHAETDRVSVYTSANKNLVWWVQGATVFLSCSSDPKDAEPVRFSGRLVFGNNVDVDVRSWKGRMMSISVHGDHSDVPVLEAFKSNDEMVFDAFDCVDIKIDDLEGAKQKGQTFVFPVSGDISIGGEISFRKNDGYLLKSGQVNILDKGLLVDHYYSVGPFELNTGDKFKVKGNSVDSVGFISLNEDDMMVVYRAKGQYGLVQRYMSEDYEISNSIWTRLYHDQTLVYLWVCVLVFFALIKVFIRFLIED